MKTKTYLVNYSTLNYRKKQRLNSVTGKFIGRIHEVFSFEDVDIEKTYFDNHCQILNNKKGAGLWLWKPYFISKALSNIEYGDVLVHCDAAAIFIKNINTLVKSLKDSNQDIMFFDLPLLEKEWTKPSLISFFGNKDFGVTNQISASFFVMIKTKKTEKFIEEWLNLCENPNLLDWFEEDKSIFKNHRYDQSILSLLAKKHKFVPFRDPSQYGEFPEMYRVHSKLYIRQHKNSTYDTSILLIRKSVWIKELMKYYMKKIIFFIAPKVYFKITKTNRRGKIII